MTTRTKPGPRVDPVRYPCGHPRTPENTITRTRSECRLCNNARQAGYRRAHQAGKRAVVTPVPNGKRGATRKYITTPAIQRAIEEARIEWNRLYGTPDSTDTAQRTLALGGEG